MGTASSKVLHILKPDLFVPWDTDIREDYNLGSYAEDYYRFLDICKKELDGVLVETQDKPDRLQRIFYQNGWKPITKLLDEAHWARVRKLPPHFIQP